MNKSEVEFVLWNMAQQMAVDNDGNVWRVDGWFGAGLDFEDTPIEMFPYGSPQFDGQWLLVEFVTVTRTDETGRQMWASIFPDDFEKGTIN